MFWLLQYGRIFTDSISVSSLVNGVVKGIKGVVRDMMISEGVTFPAETVILMVTYTYGVADISNICAVIFLTKLRPSLNQLKKGPGKKLVRRN